MDIHKWLSETVLPQQPPSPPEPREHHHAPCSEQSERITDEKRRRKQSTSDSSLLDVPPQRKKRLRSGQVPSVKEMADETDHTDASHSTSRSESSASSEPYRRKPRRKTRPERYDSVLKAAKERGLHTQRRDKGESKRARRKSRRKKANNSRSGIVQGFQAKNVPRDRLTLKPRERLGLFNKGRVSSPVKGRGLPDLVFSEMKFLQKHEDKAAAGPPSGSPRKKRKKDQAHAKEEEISAYFTSVQPALAERDLNTQMKKPSPKKLHGADRTQPIVDEADPTVEQPDQTLCLGFGGRGPRHGSRSYISWSESVRAPSATPAHIRMEADDSNGQPKCDGKSAGYTDRGDVLHSPSAPPTTTRHLANGRVGRIQVSSLHPTDERLSRSHSLPQHISSPRRIDLVDRAARRRALEHVASPSSMPPFASHSNRRCQVHRPHNPGSPELRNSSLHVPPTKLPRHRDITLDREIEPPAHGDPGQQTSSSLGRILQECNTAFHDQRIAEALQPEVREPYTGVPVQGNMRRPTELYPIIRRIPSVRFAGVEETYRRRAPTDSGLSTYGQQHERMYGYADEILGLEGTIPTSRAVEDEYFDEEVFDYAEEQWDEEAQLAGYDIGYDPLFNDTGTQQTNASVPEIIQSRGSVVAKPGFWRPHKLY